MKWGPQKKRSWCNGMKDVKLTGVLLALGLPCLICGSPTSSHERLRTTGAQNNISDYKYTQDKTQKERKRKKDTHFWWGVAGPWVKGLSPKLLFPPIPDACMRKSRITHQKHSTNHQWHTLTLDTYLKSLNILQELILLFKQKAITHPDLLVYQLSGHFHLLRRSADGEDPDVGVGVWRRISLQLHMSAGLLVDVLYGLSTWAEHKHMSMTFRSVSDSTIICNPSCLKLEHSGKILRHLMI